MAPGADVLGAADSPAIGTRSFGADTGLVVPAQPRPRWPGCRARAWPRGAKHFPGHGRTGTDTHEAIATIEGGLADLRLVDLPPFEAAIRAGTLAIMPSHLRVPELTGDLPASVSGAALTGLLRGELGFTGVIVSDALEMRATRDLFGIPQAAVLAVAAGIDLLCLGREGSEDDYLAVRDALVAAVRDGTLDGERWRKPPTGSRACAGAWRVPGRRPRRRPRRRPPRAQSVRGAGRSGAGRFRGLLVRALAGWARRSAWSPPGARCRYRGPAGY